MDEIINVEMLCIDAVTGQIFRANLKQIENARNQLNELIALNDHITMEDYVKALGLYNESDLMVGDMLGVREGPIEFIMDATVSGIKLDINKTWDVINKPWDS